jgi:hypothetical protein
MRWRLRRGDKGLGTQGVPSAPPSAAPANPPAQGWSALPPITPSWATKSPLTTGAQPIRPPLTQDRAPRRAAHRAADGAPEPGRVIGLAAVVKPAAPELPAPTAELPAYFHQQPPLRHVTARPIVEHAPLTAATDDYVGQPMAPAPAPSMAQVAQSFYQEQNAQRAQAANITATTDAGARFQEALANLPKSGLPQYLPGGQTVESRPPDRPAIEAPPASAPAPALRLQSGHQHDQPPMTHRRNSLAQSRRLGLGAPIRRDATEEGGSEPSDAEPARAHAAPLAPPAPPPPLVHPPAPPPAAAEPSVIEPVPAVPEPTPAVPAAAPPAAAASAPPAAAIAPAPVPASAAEAAAEASAPSSAPAPPRPATDRPGPRHSRGETDRQADGGPLPARESLQPATAVVRPLADGTPRPAASAAPLVFRASPPRPETKPEAPVAKAPERAVVTRAPAELAHALRSSHGIDVADVPIHRDTDAGSEAREHRARAFTRGGRVFLPEEAGPLTSAQARGLLAHELVHAAQQRRLGGSLPAEDSAEGRALEAEAVAAEQMYTHAPTVVADDAPLVHAAPAVTASWVDQRIVQRAGPAIDYLADNATLTTEQETAFKTATEEAVKQVRLDYDQRHGDQPPPTGSSVGAPPFANASEQEVAERQYLDVVNTELERLGQPPQDSLSEDDKQKVAKLLGNSSGTGTQHQIRESSRQSRWADEHLGAASAFGADIGGLLAWTPWGRTDRVEQVDKDGNPIAPGGKPPGGPGGKGTTPKTATGGPDDHESSRFSRWQEGVFGVGVGAALGADIGGLGGFFKGGQIDHQPPTTPAGGRGGTGARTGAGQQGGGAGAEGTTREGHSHAHQNFLSGGHSETGDSTGGPGDSNALDNIDMDELAVRIYDRLRSRLRRELLIDRERAGLLTDFR